MKVLVTGSCGYVGSMLVPQLLADGHQVTGVDVQWFGDGYLPKQNDSLRLIKADIRDLVALREALKGQEAVIHLACVSNDHSCQLDEALSTAINFDAFGPLVMAAKEAGVRRFIYCSSSSVYGVSEAPEIREDHPLVPLTLYNRYKGECEPILREQVGPDFEGIILRPATVCGYAPRMRFDLTVNILTAHAVLKKEITVFGGKQKRPNLHMRDMVRAYVTLLEAPAEKVNGQTFNIGGENMEVGLIAVKVQKVVHEMMGFLPSVTQTESTDKRSYHVNSDKIANVLGYVPQHTVEDAVRDLCVKFQSGQYENALTNPIYTNVKQLVDAGFAVKDSLAAYRKDRYPT